MKTTFKTTSEVAHAWANQLQNEGRYRGGNFYFDGDTIYSYGRHFPIAKHVVNTKGEKAVLFTERTYSNTTNKQIHIVRNACSHLNIIDCYDPEESATKNLAHWLEKAEEIAEALLTARKPEKYLLELGYIKNKVVRYTDFFGIEIPLTLSISLDIANKDQYLAYKERKDQYEAEEKKKELAAMIRAHKRALHKWLNLEIDLMPLRNGRDYLRVKGPVIETSQGVMLSFDYAKKLWGKILFNNLKAGDKVLDFTVSEVGKDIKIGCHVFPTSYLIDFGKRIFKG